jgi:hypothetical protein
LHLSREPRLRPYSGRSCASGSPRRVYRPSSPENTPGFSESPPDDSRAVIFSPGVRVRCVVWCDNRRQCLALRCTAPDASDTCARRRSSSSGTTTRQSRSSGSRCATVARRATRQAKVGGCCQGAPGAGLSTPRRGRASGFIVRAVGRVRGAVGEPLPSHRPITPDKLPDRLLARLDVSTDIPCSKYSNGRRYTSSGSRRTLKAPVADASARGARQ